MTLNDRTEEILYESEAALRLVDQEIYALRGTVHTDPRFLVVAAGDLPANIERANQQILKILAHLRETRTALKNTAFAKLQATHEKIREVTSATEDAAIDIMDACDRATSLVDTLDEIDAADTPDRQKASEVRTRLRDEIFLMMGALQFQDITSQQLNYSSAVLVEVESRLIEVAQHLDTNGIFERSVTQASPPSEELDYDPNATTKHAQIRQALADEIFTAIKAPAA